MMQLVNISQATAHRYSRTKLGKIKIGKKEKGKEIQNHYKLFIFTIIVIVFHKRPDAIFSGKMPNIC